jgi:hypothetical protein
VLFVYNIFIRPSKTKLVLCLQRFKFCPTFKLFWFRFVRVGVLNMIYSKYFSHIKLYANDFSCFFKWLKKYWLHILLYWSTFSLSISLFSIWIFISWLQTPICDYLNSCDSNRIFSLLLAYYWFSNLAVLIVWYSFAIAWTISSYFIYLITNLVVGYFYQLFYNLRVELFKRIQRINSFLHKNVFKKSDRVIRILFIIFIPISTVIMLEVKGESDVDLVTAAHLLGIIVTFFACPIVLINHWSRLIIILRNRKNTSILHEYIFSVDATRRTFKFYLDSLIFLAIMGWFILPIFIYSMNAITLKTASVLNVNFNYENLWSSISKDIAAIRDINPNKSFPPPPDSLAISVAPISSFLKPQKYLQSLIIIQRYFFLTTSIYALVSIGLPFALKLISIRGYKKTFQRILIITLKTTILFALVNLVIEKAYFIDISDPIGSGFLFSFFMSFFFNQDSETMNNRNGL